MLSLDLFKHFLFSRRSGSLIRIVAGLCILGVTIGVASLIIVISVMNGFQGSLRDRLLAIEPHLVISLEGETRAKEYLKHPIHKFLKEQPDTKVFVMESQDVILRTIDGIVHAAIARGVDKESMDFILTETERVARKLGGLKGDLSPENTPELHSDLRPGEVLMGLDLANLLNVFEGDKLTIVPPEGLLLPPGEIPPFETLTVRGVIDSNYGDHDSKMIYYHRGKSFYRLRDTASRELGFEVRVKDPENIGPLKKRLEAMGGTVSTWKERNSSLLFALWMERFIVGLLLGMSALIAGFSIITVIVLLMTQKKRDMGVFMALGLSLQKTRGMFMRLGLILSSLGLVLGLGIGLVVCFVVDKYSAGILPDIYYDSSIPAKVDPIQISTIVFLSLAFCLVAAWLSTRKYRYLTPSEALRDNAVSSNTAKI